MSKICRITSFTEEGMSWERTVKEVGGCGQGWFKSSVCSANKSEFHASQGEHFIVLNFCIAVVTNLVSKTLEEREPVSCAAVLKDRAG